LRLIAKEDAQNLTGIEDFELVSFLVIQSV